MHSDFPGFQRKETPQATIAGQNPPAFIFQDFKISSGECRVEAVCGFGCRRMFTCRVRVEFYYYKAALSHWSIAPPAGSPSFVNGLP